MTDIKKEMRRLIEAMEGIDETSVDSEKKLEEAYNNAEEAMHGFMARIKKLHYLINKFAGLEDKKAQWYYEIALLDEQLRDFFKGLSY